MYSYNIYEAYACHLLIHEESEGSQNFQVASKYLHRSGTVFLVCRLCKCRFFEKDKFIVHIRFFKLVTTKIRSHIMYAKYECG